LISFKKQKPPHNGVYIGAWQDPDTKETLYLRHDGPEHILVFAPTRSGKGVGLVIPTLLSWPESAVIHDVKGENWALTAGWRQRELGSICLKFDPACSLGASVKFNPLEEIRIGTEHEVKDAQNIATMIVDPDGKGLNDHWTKTGFSLLVGTILHVLYAEKDKTLRGVVSYLSDPSFKLVEQIFLNMINTIHDKENKFAWRDTKGNPTRTHPVVAACAKDMLNKSDNERSGVLSTAMSFLNIYRDPIVAKNTEKSEFKIRDLMHHEKPVSLYIIAPPSDKDRLKPLFRLLFNQIVRTLTETLPTINSSYKHRLLLMIDEFPALGKLDIFAESLSFIAGYGLKAYLIAQDLTQIYAAYGRDESIISNCHIRVAFAPNKLETAQILSSMIGSMTITVKNKSYAGNKLSPLVKNLSHSETDQKRPLLTPDEVMRLPSDDALIFVAGHRPIYGKKIKYYEDPTFLERSKIPAPVESDVIMKTTEKPYIEEKKHDYKEESFVQELDVSESHTPRKTSLDRLS
jgi:type IV secretion system protein VirD4